MTPSDDLAKRMADFDSCHCGDYRHQHDARGCLICRAGNRPWDSCNGFHLFQKADSKDPNVIRALMAKEMKP